MKSVKIFTFIMLIAIWSISCDEDTASPPLGSLKPTNTSLEVIDANTIRISWQGGNDVTGYEIERQEGGALEWNEVATVDAPQTAYDDTGLNALVEYYYRIRSFTEIEDTTYFSDFTDPIMAMTDDYEDTIPPENGNMLILNYSDRRLVLYVDGVRHAIIPAIQSGCLVNIQSDGSSTSDLWICLLDSVRSHIDDVDPGGTSIYKRWVVLLSAGTHVDKRVTWHITDSYDQINSATLRFRYLGGTSYNVDVHLGHSDGPLVATLTPNVNEKIVGVDYNVWTILYHYWESDQGDTEGRTPIGWTDKEIVNGEEVFIYAVVNSETPERDLRIPHYNPVPVPGPYGNLRVFNVTAQPIEISVNGRLIERVAYNDGERAWLSVISANDNIEYILPIDDEAYLFEAKYLPNNMLVATLEQKIISDSTIIWRVEP